MKLCWQLQLLGSPTALLAGTPAGLTRGLRNRGGGEKDILLTCPSPSLCSPRGKYWWLFFISINGKGEFRGWGSDLALCPRLHRYDSYEEYQHERLKREEYRRDYEKQEFERAEQRERQRQKAIVSQLTQLPSHSLCSFFFEGERGGGGVWCLTLGLPATKLIKDHM